MREMPQAGNTAYCGAVYRGRCIRCSVIIVVRFSSATNENLLKISSNRKNIISESYPAAGMV